MRTTTFYNAHRWYEQQTGRYTRPDPLGLRSGAHLYDYVFNNPLRFSDSLGLKAAQACGFTWVGALGAVGDMNNQVIFCAPCECGPKKINGVGFGDDPPPPPGVEPPAGIASVPSTPSIPFTTYDRCRCSSNDKVYVNVQTRRSLIPAQFFNNAGKVSLDYDCPREKK